MPERTLSIEGIRVTRFLYGTAWKEDETRRLTELAMRAGFRGIDTANQRRHYDEAAVGRAVAAAIEGGLVAREDLFLQTKFTFRSGQDHRLPYDPDAPIPVQVEQSFRLPFDPDAPIPVQVEQSFASSLERRSRRRRRRTPAPAGQVGRARELSRRPGAPPSTLNQAAGSRW